MTTFFLIGSFFLVLVALQQSVAVFPPRSTPTTTRSPPLATTDQEYQGCDPVAFTLHTNGTIAAVPNRNETLSMPHARARIIVFQRDGGQRLHELLLHYAHVVDDIVVLDHYSAPQTHRVLWKWQQRQTPRVHVWKCKGPFDIKHKLWTQTIRQYANQTDFVIPIDVDEYLSVSLPQEHHRLVWNRQAFYDTLDRIEVLAKEQGKPIKMQGAQPIPLDCTEYAHWLSTSLPSLQHSDKMQADWCQTRHVFRPHPGQTGCGSKTLFWGPDFYRTDTGNHMGATLRYPNMGRMYKICQQEGFSAAYTFSDLVLIHVQSFTFADWLVHGLRGAADSGANQHLDFRKLECKPGMKSQHYCEKWKQFAAEGFSPYKLREIYLASQCPKTAHGLQSIENVTAPSCT